MSKYDPSSPYSASKAASDHFVKAFYKTYNTPIILSNCSNNYGPWQYKEKLIPVVINSILKKNNIPVYGNGKNIRDWIYIDDHISAINLILDKGVIGESYCIGSNNEISNIDLIKKICKISDNFLDNNSNSFEFSRSILMIDLDMILDILLILVNFKNLVGNQLIHLMNH